MSLKIPRQCKEVSCINSGSALNLNVDLTSEKRSKKFNDPSYYILGSLELMRGLSLALVWIPLHSVVVH